MCEARVSSDGKARRYFQFIVWKRGLLDNARVAQHQARHLSACCKAGEFGGALSHRTLPEGKEPNREQHFLVGSNIP